MEHPVDKKEKKKKIDRLATTGIRSIIFELAYFVDGFHFVPSMVFFFFVIPLPLSVLLYLVFRNGNVNYSSKQQD